MVAKRLGLGILTIIVISVLIFLGVEALPGDVATAILGQEATPETVAAFRKELKLDLPCTLFCLAGRFYEGKPRDISGQQASDRRTDWLAVCQHDIFSLHVRRDIGAAGNFARASGSALS